MGLGGVQSFGAVTAVRFLLGVFEAGECDAVPYPKRLLTTSQVFSPASCITSHSGTELKNDPSE